MPRPKGIYTSRLDQHRDRILYLYNVLEYSTVRISEILPFSQQVIHRWLKRHGFIRTRTQASRIRHGWHVVKPYTHTPTFLRLVANVNRDIKGTSENDWTIARKYNCLPEFVRRQRRFLNGLGRG